MSIPSSKLFSTAVMAVALAASSAVIVTPVVGSPAYAQGNSAGKGNSDERGRGNDRESRSSESRTNGRPESSATAEARDRGRGALASELKGLNAANASPQALANASPDSMPGRLAAFKSEYQAVYDATVARNDATEALEDYPEFSSDFDVGSEEYNAALTQYEAELTALQTAASDAATALAGANTEYQASYLALTDGVVLSAEAQDELMRLLGLR